LAHDQLYEFFPKVRGLRLSMVCDTRLQTFGDSKTSDDVSTPLDRALLLHLRKVSDLAITDAATAVAEHYKQSKFVDIEIWTKTGFTRGLQNLAATAELGQLTVKHVEDVASRVTDLLAIRQSILLESGLTLSKELASKNLIDEACITITRASHEPEALITLQNLQSKIGLNYLTRGSHVWLEETLFARLQR
jgi:riboflavin biosynthesis pyrimidine reductase